MNPPQIDEFAQESQQPTQVATQPELHHGVSSTFLNIDELAYACFQPCSSNAALSRIDLVRPKREYTVGRGQQNDVRLKGMKISFQHCKIIWDGSEADSATFMVQDNSTNGTWVNGEKIQRAHKIIVDGNEVAFGTPMEQRNNESEDYRYIFRVLTRAHRQRGIHANYDLAHELGKGSFATVMKALHKPTGQYYAVKIIHGSKVRGNDQAKLTAFDREITILESLDHPNICRMKEKFAEKDDENIYLVLELVQGGDLLDFIINNNGLDENMTRHISLQLCSALEYIHGKGITHRDLKPENILLTQDDPPVVKVADFGLAKVVDQLTMLRTMCGTPNYLAPEVVLSSSGQGYDQKVDSFSFGVIVYSMLTNCAPFEEDESLNIRDRIMSRRTDWETLRRRTRNPAIFDFIKKLIETDPAKRMSLTEALQHPFLTGRGNVEPVEELFQSSSQDSDASFTGLADDVSMLSAYPSGATATPPPPPPPPPASQRLERRSQVLARDAETKAQAQGPPASSSPASSDLGSGGKRARVSGVMDVIDEEMEQGAGGPSAKRGRMDVDDAENGAGPSDDAARGKARAPHSTANGNGNANGAPTPPRVTRAAAAAAAQEDVRRSSRPAAKARR